MFLHQCGDCGERWYIGNPSACKCPDETPQREWVGLTIDEILSALKSVDPETKRLPKGFADFAYAVEAKLKEKNK